MNEPLEHGLRVLINTMLDGVLKNLRQDCEFDQKYDWMKIHRCDFINLTETKEEETLVLTAELREQLNKLLMLQWELERIINRAAYGQGFCDGIQTVSFIGQIK